MYENQEDDPETDTTNTKIYKEITSAVDIPPKKKEQLIGQ